MMIVTVMIKSKQLQPVVRCSVVEGTQSDVESFLEVCLLIIF